MFGLCGDPDLITAPAVEPLTRAEAKRHSKILHAAEDKDIDDWIAAARELLEERWACALCTQTWELALGELCGREIWLPKPPLQSVTYVKYYDTSNTQQTLSSSSYHVRTPHRFAGSVRLAATASWPAAYDRPDAWVLRYVCGYGATAAVPPAVKHAMKLIVGHYSEFREAMLTGTITKEIELGVDALGARLAWSRAAG